jgi:hypothetical protein
MGQEGGYVNGALFPGVRNTSIDQAYRFERKKHIAQMGFIYYIGCIPLLNFTGVQ